MKRVSYSFICILMAVVFLTAMKSGQSYAQTITCSSGSFGTVSTQATLTGPNNMSMATSGVITYPATLTGPATGTPITCNLSGWGGNKNISVDCDAARSIANPGGCCGDTNKNMTSFSAFGSGNGTDGPTNCNNIGGSGTLRFKTTGAGTATLVFGTTMDATHVKIGGTYLLSNNAAGVLNIEVKEGGTTRTQTADFAVTFASLVGFTNTVDMDFGTLGFVMPVIGADRVSLGTDGSAVYSGNFSPQGGTVRAGSVLLNNVENGVTVEIYCDKGARMAKSGASSSSIRVRRIEVAAENTRGVYGSGSPCDGINGAPATTMLYLAGSRDEFFLGGELFGGSASAFTDGSYSTANAGGNDIRVTVLNQ